jgi:hypothetical protein
MQSDGSVDNYTKGRVRQKISAIALSRQMHEVSWLK